MKPRRWQASSIKKVALMQSHIAYNIAYSNIQTHLWHQHPKPFSVSFSVSDALCSYSPYNVHSAKTCFCLTADRRREWWWNTSCQLCHSLCAGQYNPSLFSSEITHNIKLYWLSDWSDYLQQFTWGVTSLMLQLRFIVRLWLFYTNRFYLLYAHLNFLFCSTAGFVCTVSQCVRLNRLSVGFWTHPKSLHFHFISVHETK